MNAPVVMSLFTSNKLNKLTMSHYYSDLQFNVMCAVKSASNACSQMKLLAKKAPSIFANGYATPDYNTTYQTVSLKTL